MLQENLSKYLSDIDRVFNIDQLLSDNEYDENSVINYYSQSDLGYRIVHSLSGCIHMSLNHNNIFNKTGYFRHAEIVNEYIKKNATKKVLELASAKGFNSIHLANQNKFTDFFGIDITPKFVSEATKKAKSIPNIHFSLGDYNNLKFPKDYFDIIFVIEALCHSKDIFKSLAESNKVLKRGGYLIIIDGFKGLYLNEINNDAKKAAQLVELSMLVNFLHIDEFINMALRADFEIEKINDLSHAIIPNLIKLNSIAKKFYKFMVISKILTKILPNYLVKNSIAGLLMPITVSSKVHKYFSVVLKKE